MEEELPLRAPETIMSATLLGQEGAWSLFFDGSAAGGKGGAGIVLVSPEGRTFTLSLQLNFP